MELTTEKKNIIEILYRQDFVPLNVIGILENMDGNVFFDEASNSVWAENQYFNYISGSATVICKHLDQLEAGFYGFSAVQHELAEAVYGQHLLHWYEATDRFVVKDEKTLESDWRSHAPYEIVSIPIEEARGIDDRYEYKQDGSFERICDAITRRPTSAIYIHGELASYVLVHEDNSIGYMYTLEKYRHKGLGYWVTLDILEKMKKRNAHAFVEINRANFKSQGLAAKSGFKKDAYTPWFGIIKGVPEFFKTWDPLNGNSFIFTSIAHLRHVNQLKTDIQEVKVEKSDDNYNLTIDEERKYAIFKMVLDESKEAYIVHVSTLENMDLYEVVKAIAIHFPESNASIVLPYDVKLVEQIGGIPIVKG
ncbi:GNAT family N-acetyltransferase [Fusibacter bizertensis]